jgi:hypothetical protein
MGDTMKTRALFLVVVAVVMNGCYTFSVFNSATLVKPGKFQLIPSISLLSLNADGESTRMTNNIGLQGTYGLNSRANIGLRFERLLWHEDNYVFRGEGFNYFDVNLKTSIIPDKLAISVPVGMHFGEDIELIETIQINPALHLSLPISSRVLINFSTKLLYFFDEDSDLLIAYNLGASIYNLSSKYFVVPELGFLTYPGDPEYFFHYGIGVGINL